MKALVSGEWLERVNQKRAKMVNPTARRGKHFLFSYSSRH